MIVFIKLYRNTFFILFILLATSCNSTAWLDEAYKQSAFRNHELEEETKDNPLLYHEITNWLGVRHVNGAMSHRGIDCSGLVDVIYSNVYGKSLARNSRQIMNKNCVREDKDELREGDLVFFNTGRGQKNCAHINHVGIYLKNNKFVHASSSHGVMVSDLNEAYYQRTWVCGGKVTEKNPEDSISISELAEIPSKKEILIQ